ncbi:tent2-a, partial [Symbiodinium natans]
MLRVWRASGHELPPYAVDGLCDVKALKQDLQLHCGQPRFRQRLLHAGAVLDDGTSLDAPMHLQMVLLPLISASDDQRNELIDAVHADLPSRVEEILQRPQDPDLTGTSEHSGSQVPLCIAASQGFVETARLLLEAGANKDQEGGHGHPDQFQEYSTPLILASLDSSVAALVVASGHGHVEVVERLLETRVDEALASPAALEAIACASHYGFGDVVHRLLEAGVGQSMLGSTGAAAIACICAATQGKIAIVKWLVVSCHSTTLQLVGNVGELIEQIALTDVSRAHVESITEAVRATLLPVLPTARVDGYVTANPMGGTAFGVAVPDVEIVVLSNPKVLSERATKDAGKFQKALIRTCTDRLVSHGSFKFRRSAFRGAEPKVTLISPTVGGQAGIPFNLAVNAATPARSSAVFEACSQLETRAGELILLVRRWAKDRGISHAAKGHLSPYSWMLLAVYYLQVGLDEQEQLLPDMGFLSSGKRPAKPATNCTLSTGELLKGFMRFYAKFGWGSEIVSVRRGMRLPPNDSLPRRQLDKAGNPSLEAPIIEDPFEADVNLGASMHWLSAHRLVEEFARSTELCSRGASLAELLEPWTPPEQEE